MRLKRLIIFLALSLFSKWGIAQAWTQLPDFPGYERDDGSAFVINNTAYCGSGLQVGWALTRDFYKLDLTTNTWTTAASLPSGAERQYACGFTDGSDGYIFGGEAGGNDLNDLWMYSPSLDSWMAMPSKPGNGVRGASCFVLYNTAYIIGGAYSSTNALNEVWAYNITSGTWTQKNNLPFTCWRSSATAINNKGYLTFGRDVNGRFRNELYEYNPVADTWTQINTFPGAGRAYCTMQNINNDIFLFGGLDTLNNYYNTVWSYDIGSSQWTQRTSLTSFGRKGGMGFSNNNILYYTCGIDQGNNRLKETWKYDVTVGIKEIEKEEALSIYPNPASDLIMIKDPESILQNKAYKLINMQGEVVLNGILHSDNQILLGKLNRGIYQLIIENRSAKISVQ
jgi:N-acetylneuraminic acid mutarotase